MNKRQAKKMSVLLNKNTKSSPVNEATVPGIVLADNYYDIGRKKFS